MYDDGYKYAMDAGAVDRQPHMFFYGFLQVVASSPLIDQGKLSLTRRIRVTHGLVDRRARSGEIQPLVNLNYGKQK